MSDALHKNSQNISQAIGRFGAIEGALRKYAELLDAARRSGNYDGMGEFARMGTESSMFELFADNIATILGGGIPSLLTPQCATAFTALKTESSREA